MKKIKNEELKEVSVDDQMKPQEPFKIIKDKTIN